MPDPVVAPETEPQISQSQVEKMLKAAADAAVEAYAKSTDPATRPGVVNPAPADKTDDVPAIKGAREALKKGYLPPGAGAVVRNIVDATIAEKGVDILKVGFPRGDIDNFSMARVAFAKSMADGAEGSGAWMKYAPWETKYYAALAKLGNEFKAAGDMVSGQDGGFLAPEAWATTFFDQLYAAQIFGNLPITRMNMGTRVTHLPKLTGAVTISYSAENAALSASQPQFAQLSFTARKQYAFVQISNEMIRDSAPAADSVIQQHATKRMALDRDSKMLLGDGSAGSPVGLLNAGGIGPAALTLSGDSGNGATPTYKDLVTGIVTVESLNNSTSVPVGQAVCTGVVGAVRVKQTLMNLTDANNRPLLNFGLQGMAAGTFPGLLGVPSWQLSTLVPVNITKGTSTDTSYLFYGDWQYLVLMQRQDVEFMSTNVGGTAFQNDQTWIRLISRYDVGVIHPEAFAYHAGVRG